MLNSQGIKKTIALTGLEYRKMIRQKLHLIGAGVIAFFTVLSSLGFIMHKINNAKRKIEGETTSELLNGIAFSMTCLVPAIYILFPMIISIFTAASMAGELQNGQIRTLLLRPVSRWTVFCSKFLIMSFYSFFLVVAIFVMTYTAGAIMFGPTGDVVIFGEIFLGNGSKFILPENIVMTRLLMMYGFACFSTIYLVAMNLMIAAVVRRVSHAIVVSLGIYYTSYFFQTLIFMKYLHPFLPTRYLSVWRFPVMRDIPWDRVFHDGAIDLCYIASFLIIGGIAFNMTDV